MANTQTIRKTLPRTTLVKAVKAAVRRYQINTKTGQIFNKTGQRIGGTTYEPRITVHLEGKKYNPRVSKIIGYVAFGTEALQRNVQVRHKNGNKFDNRRNNLKLVYNNR